MAYSQTMQNFTRLALAFLSLQIFAMSSEVVTASQEEVILLHGGYRTSRSMKAMEQALMLAGYKVRNLDYPSNAGAIQKLAEDAITPAIADCERDGAASIL